MIHHFFNVVEIYFGLKRVVNAIVPGVEQFLVVHLGVVAKMRVTRGFDKPVRHERARGNDGFDHGRFNEVTKNESHLADG